MNNFFSKHNNNNKITWKNPHKEVNIVNNILTFFNNNKILLLLIIIMVVFIVLVYKNNKLQKQIYTDHIQDLQFYKLLSK